MGSTRLPGKVLLPILGKPMLAHQVERIQRSMLVDEIIIATSTNPRDDAIEDLAGSLDVLCFRGSEDRVLDRVVSALRSYEVELNVDFCGDCPMSDPTIIDAVIGTYLKNQERYDYVGTGLKTTFPPGLDVIVYPAAILFDAMDRVTRPEEYEHVAVNIRSRPEIYRTFNLEAPPWLRYPELYLEVDAAEDFELITMIFEALYPSNPCFALSDIVQFLDGNPALAQSNRHIHRRWKAFRES
jgi:spore coat polysaccharide biosynthesis protein SpsF